MNEPTDTTKNHLIEFHGPLAEPALPQKPHHKHHRNRMPLNAALAPDKIQPRLLPKQSPTPKASSELKPQ